MCVPKISELTKKCFFPGPGVDGAVLETPLSLIHKLIQQVTLLLQIFKTPYNSYAVRARDLQF